MNKAGLKMLDKIPDEIEFLLIRLRYYFVSGPFGYNKILIWLLLVSFIALVSLPKNAHGNIRDISISYVSSFVFYFITILLPEIHKQYSLLRQVAWRIYKIGEPFEHLCASIGKKPITGNHADWDEFCSTVSPINNYSYHYFQTFQFIQQNDQQQWVHLYLNFHESIIFMKNKMSEEMDRLNSLISFFDNDLMIYAHHFTEKINDIDKRILQLNLCTNGNTYSIICSETLWFLDISLAHFKERLKPFLND